MQATPRRPAPRPVGKLAFEQLLDMLMETGAIDAVQKKDLLSRKDTLRAKFLRERFGPQGLKKKDYNVAATELVDAAKIPHPQAPGRTIDEDILAQLLAQATKLPYKKIDPLQLDMGLITRTLPKGFARRHLILPIGEKDGRLTVAIADPYDTVGLQEYARASGREIDEVVAAKKDIVQIITQTYGFRQAVNSAAKDISGGARLQNLEQLVRVRSSDEIDPGDQKIVAAVEYLLNAAFDHRASDIHIEPKREVSKLRLRIDGILHDIGEILRGCSRRSWRASRSWPAWTSRKSAAPRMAASRPSAESARSNCVCPRYRWPSAKRWSSESSIRRFCSPR